MSLVEDETFLLDISSIIVPPDRHRSEMDDEKLNELAQSIKTHGQIHPIVVTRAKVLVVGARRLAAMRLLAHDFILCRYADDRTDEREYKALEYVENSHREDLSWQDKIKATYEYHMLMKGWKEGWTAEKTAGALALSDRTVRDHISVYTAGLDGNEQVLGATTLSSARSAVQREFERAVDSELEALDMDREPLFDTDRHPKEELRSASKDILEANFLKWDRGSGPRYNLIHCDFPYGIGLDKGGTQTGMQHHGSYADDPDLYWKLCHHLINADIVAESAHIIFWFSMHHYEATKDLFTAGGFTVSPFPLIWHKSDNAGLLPDPNRGPRRIYETALFMSKGDRKIVRPTTNLISYPANKDKALHPSEKPMPVLRHFLTMLVDSSTILLDPTCGSGGAVLVAEELGAIRSTGLEINRSHVENAQRRLNIWRRGRADQGLSGSSGPDPDGSGGGGAPEAFEDLDLDLEAL